MVNHTLGSSTSVKRMLRMGGHAMHLQLREFTGAEHPLTISAYSSEVLAQLHRDSTLAKGYELWWLDCQPGLY